MQGQAFGAAALLLFLAFAGCAGPKSQYSEEEIAHMVTPSRGAISGVVVDRNNRSIKDLNVKLHATNSNDLAGEVVTGPDGRFYFQRLFPTQYRITVNLKDWTDCIVQVYPGKFTNLTISQPVYPQKPKSC